MEEAAKFHTVSLSHSSPSSIFCRKKVREEAPRGWSEEGRGEEEGENETSLYKESGLPKIFRVGQDCRKKERGGGRGKERKANE